MEAIVQLVAVGLLLGAVVLVKLHDAKEVLELASQPAKRKHWKKTVAAVVLSLLGTAALLDPLIPGMPTLTVRAASACAAYDRLPDHLRVKVIPLGLGERAGGDRITDASLGADGSVQIVATLAMLDTHVLLQIYDETAPGAVIYSDTIYINPFVRRQLIGKTITLCKAGETHE